VITPAAGSLVTYLKDTWKYRSLVATFARRDLKVKYAQTWLGLGWTLVQPVVALLLFTFFFGYILDWKTGELPYALYVYSGLLGWNLFSYIVLQGTGSLQESSHIIKKVYFPRLILPLGKVLVGLADMLVSFSLLVGLMIWYGQPPSWKIIFLPAVIAANILCALTLVSWISAMAYRIRDLFHLVPFVMYFGIWITPVFFTRTVLPENLRFVWALNPMTGIVEAWRWCLFGEWQFNPDYLFSLLAVILLCISGVWAYSRNESSFSDFV